MNCNARREETRQKQNLIINIRMDSPTGSIKHCLKNFSSIPLIIWTIEVFHQGSQNMKAIKSAVSKLRGLKAKY